MHAGWALHFIDRWRVIEIAKSFVRLFYSSFFCRSQRMQRGPASRFPNQANKLAKDENPDATCVSFILSDLFYPSTRRILLDCFYLVYSRFRLFRFRASCRFFIFTLQLIRFDLDPPSFEPWSVNVAIYQRCKKRNLIKWWMANHVD